MSLLLDVAASLIPRGVIRIHMSFEQFIAPMRRQ